MIIGHRFLEKKILKVLTIYGFCDHFGHVTNTCLQPKAGDDNFMGSNSFKNINFLSIWSFAASFPIR